MADSFPGKRKECINGLRPCPWIRCKYHLIWDVKVFKSNSPRMLLKLSDEEIIFSILSLRESCSLDVAGRGEQTLEEIGKILNVSRERARQIIGSEICAPKYSIIRKLRHRKRREKLAIFNEA